MKLFEDQLLDYTNGKITEVSEFNVTVFQKDTTIPVDLFEKDGSSKSNPFYETTSTYSFYVEDGTYDIVISKSGYSNLIKKEINVVEEPRNTQSYSDIAFLQGNLGSGATVGNTVLDSIQGRLTTLESLIGSSEDAKFSVDSFGNVGIKTNTPQASLDLNVNSDDTGLGFRFDDSIIAGITTPGKTIGSSFLSFSAKEKFSFRTGGFTSSTSTEQFSISNLGAEANFNLITPSLSFKNQNTTGHTVLSMATDGETLLAEFEDGTKKEVISKKVNDDALLQQNRGVILASNGDSGASNATQLGFSAGEIHLEDSSGDSFRFTDISLPFSNWTSGFVGFSAATAGATLQAVVEGDKSNRTTGEIKIVQDYESYRAALASNKAVANFENQFGILPSSTTEFYSFRLENGVRDLNSVITLRQGNGHGSTNTTIRRWSVIYEQYGAFVGTLTLSATLGTSIEIPENGIYELSGSDGATSSVSYVGISKNSSELSTGIESIETRDVIYSTREVNAIIRGLSATSQLSKGDVIRWHTDGAPNRADNTSQNFFRIIQILKL